jgi:hypothetical protein
MVNEKIEPIDDYPIWIIDSTGKHTEQTSGIYYLGKLDGKKVFLTCDDIGKLNKLLINENIIPPFIEIKEIGLSNEIRDVFSSFRKKDFEAISFDSKKNNICISVEGYAYNKKDPVAFKKQEGIYELNFNKDVIRFDSLVSIHKLEIPETVYEHTQDNIGIEGLAVTDNYYFLGLENCRTKTGSFTDSTFLYIINKETNGVITIPTKELNISSICGLYAKSDLELYGIDRNTRSMFRIKFNPDFTVDDIEIKEIDLQIPDHKDINQILGVAPESITLDEYNYIYVTVDPWRDYYKPDTQDKKKLNEKEKEYFKNTVPIIYKFENPF